MRRCVAVAALLMLASCKTNTERYNEIADQVIAKYRPKLTERLEQLRAVQAAAKARPPLTTVQAPASPPMSDEPFVGFLEDTKLDDPQLRRDGGCGPMYGYGEPFATLSGYRPPWPVAELEPSKKHREELESELKNALQHTHAIVCVQLKAEEPKLSGGDTFTGGTYTGECRVYEIATAKYLGGAALDVQVQSAVGKSAEAALSERMANEVKWALERALKPFGKVDAPYFGCHW